MVTSTLEMRQAVLAPAAVLALMVPCRRAFADDANDLVTPGVSDEISASTSTATSSAPRSGFYGDDLRLVAPGLADVFVRGEAAWTHDLATAAPQGSTFGGQGGDVFSFALGAAWTPAEAVIVGVEVDASPSSSTLAPTSVAATSPAGRTRNVYAQLRATSSEVGGNAFGSVRLVDGVGAQTFARAELGVSILSTQQQFTAVQAPGGGAVPLPDVAAFCASHACPESLRAELAGQTQTIQQWRGALTVKETLAKDTDLVLTGAAYAYGNDPQSGGNYSLASFRRTTFRFGGGVPTAPVDWSLELDATRRIGTFEAAVTAQYARYTAGQGDDVVLSLQGKLALSEPLSLWLRIVGQRDADGNADVLLSGVAVAGIGWQF